MKDATRVVRAGLPDVAQGQAFLPGPTFAGTYHLAGDPESSAYTYGRYDNPTWSAYEKAIGELEGATSTISIGCEDVQDLIADLSKALDAAHGE
jgi:cystathionine gamma-lyase